MWEKKTTLTFPMVIMDYGRNSPSRPERGLWTVPRMSRLAVSRADMCNSPSPVTSEGIELVIPQERAMSPITAENQKRTGAMPDIEAPPDDALPVAWIPMRTCRLSGRVNPNADVVGPMGAYRPPLNQSTDMSDNIELMNKMALPAPARVGPPCLAARAGLGGTDCPCVSVVPPRRWRDPI